MFQIQQFIPQLRQLPVIEFRGIEHFILYYIQKWMEMLSTVKGMTAKFLATVYVLNGS